MYERLLEDIGLTKGEITVYLTLLKIGETTTGKIIEEAQISSGKIYEILDKLIKKGLVSFIIKEKTKYFSATNPRRILDFLKEKETKLKEKEKEVEKILPQLIGLKKAKEEYSVTLYKGLRGIESAAYEALNELTKKDIIHVIGIQSKKSKAYNLFWTRWHKERIKRKIECKVIFSDKGTEYYDLFKKMPLTKVKVMPSLTFSTIDIMGDRTMIFNFIDPSVIIIINKEIANKFKEFFETLWKIAKL